MTYRRKVGVRGLPIDGRPERRSRVLMFSQRNIYDVEVWRSAVREFEQIIGEIDSVDLLAPHPLKWFAHRKRLALSVGKDSTILLNPGVPRITLDRPYDLFVAFCEKTSELLNVNGAVGHWRDWCRTSVCWLNELWAKEISLHKSSLRVLSKFDYVLSPLSQSVAPINGVISGKCLFMPFGVDAIRFFPYATPANRVIDVLSVGRRSAQVHQSLLQMAREGKIFYSYDTIADLHTHNLDEHRFLIVSMAKRSRYFVVGPAKLDLPDERGAQSEIGSRFFEGAAAGTIMIGDRPRNEHFEDAFPWTDAVLELPQDARGIERVIREMDGQPERQDQVRRTNVAQALLRHDWVYRWEAVLKAAGLEPLPQLMRRKKMLHGFARMVTEQRSDVSPAFGRLEE